MASLSEKLRRERELRGISLKQISDDTKIGVRFLEALEEDRLELIPGDFYRRSYLRAYARYLGLDEDRAVNAYEFAHQAKKTDTEEEVKRPAGTAWLPWILLTLVIVAIVLMLVRPRPERASSRANPEMSQQKGGRGSADAPAGSLGSVATAAAGTVPADSRPDASTSPATAEAAPALARPPAGDARTGALRLVVAVTEPCWLEIEADGEIVTSGLKENGFRQAIAADAEVRLWLGNAGGVSFWINDRALRPLGRAGQVRKDVTITPDNYMEFVREGSASP